MGAEAERASNPRNLHHTNFESGLIFVYDRAVRSREITDKIRPILRQHNVAFAGLFGSRARGDERTDSDVDLLVRFSKQAGLFELIGLERDLSAALNLKVDVVTEGALSPQIKPHILKDLKPIYGEG